MVGIGRCKFFPVKSLQTGCKSLCRAWGSEPRACDRWTLSFTLPDAPLNFSVSLALSLALSLSLSLLVYNIYLYIYVCILATIFFLYLCVVLSILCMHTHTHARAVLSLLSQLASTCGQTRVFPTAARICIFQGYTQSVSDGARSMQEPVLQARLFGVVL